MGAKIAMQAGARTWPGTCSRKCAKHPSCAFNNSTKAPATTTGRLETPPDVAKTKGSGLTRTQDVAYTNDNSMARLHTETIPTSTLASTARVVDGFVTTQSATDGRGNTTTTHTDLAGRSISSTDAAGNTTATVYDEDFDAPSVVTNAQGKTACYKYDLRGRKVAEWGTAIQSPRRLVGGLDKCAAFAPKGRGRNGVRPSQPALFGYDDADNLTALTTFRADSGDITTDPSERTDGDTTTWAYHPAAGVELSKTYADNSQVVKTYDAFNRLATETNARGIVKTLSYDAATGQLTGISFSDDETPSQSFAYNILGQLTQVTDAAGTRTLAYNEYSELQILLIVASSRRFPRLHAAQFGLVGKAFLYLMVYPLGLYLIAAAW